jgi:uncharacterized protein YggE
MNEEFCKAKHVGILVSLALFMAIVAMASYATLNFEKVDFINPTPATISVSGEGEVLAVPDIGQFSFSVTAKADGASEAQELSGTKINDIYTYLLEQGIEEKDIKTQNYNLYPKWDYVEKICEFGVRCGSERVQDGFEVSQTVSVKIRDTKTSGAVISGVGERGATNISGLNFTIDDTDLLKEEARAMAIEDAKAKADTLAEQLGVKIVRLASYNENGGGYYEKSYDTRAMSLGMAEDEGGFGGAEMPVGEESTKVIVNVTFEVK